ncbi:MAG: MscL family protein, partial [Chitinophagales bacterium]|nr:MscL family protein [Chitinophagales bacterium]
PANTLNWGMFLQNVFEFLIIGLALFLVIRAINFLQRKKYEGPEYSTQEKLLIEIRDALNK